MAETGVRAPLPAQNLPFVYRLGRLPFKQERGVRFPYGGPTFQWRNGGAAGSQPEGCGFDSRLERQFLSVAPR